MASEGEEGIRIAALHDLGLLDTEPEERYDRVTRLARHLFDVPIALFSLVDTDRQWFKSCFGLDLRQTPRAASFCAHAIRDGRVLVVEDAAADPRFADNPLVTGAPGIRFYAGCPVAAPGGARLGTLCVIDTVPRSFSSADRTALSDLAAIIERELALGHAAILDDLTGLVSRRGVLIGGAQTLALARRAAMPVTLIHMNLDRFGAINERFGQAEGDRALATFADVMRNTFRDADMLGRIGGDKFVALLVDCRPQGAAALMDRFLAALDQRNRREDRGYAITVSAGWLGLDLDRHRTFDDLLAEGERAMSARKVLA